MGSGTCQQPQVTTLRPQGSGCAPPEPEIPNREGDFRVFIFYFLFLKIKYNSLDGHHDSVINHLHFVRYNSFV